MAVLYESSVGYFVCHRTLSQENCSRPYKHVLFDIRTPFLKDQEAMCKAQAMEGKVLLKRKRKRREPEEKQLPLEESSVLSFLSEISHLFQPSPSSSDFVVNNKPARDMVKQFLTSKSYKIQDINLTMSYVKSSGQIEETEICEEKFIIPPFSEFYKNDVTYLNTIAETRNNFSLIIVDPPWTNRFVKRKRHSGGSCSYHSMENDSLAKMPIKHLCAEGAVVAIWCTNSKNHLDYLINVLLPCWNLKYVGTWFWIKVTVSGSLVCEWNGPSGKHPFERIILARKQNFSISKPSDLIPDKKLVVSVPCAIHSFKPPLQKLLQPFLRDNNKGETLELFARSLLPNTVSLGNQVPLLQHVSLFEED